ncbi:MAG TPA: hypothetical protein DEG63_10760, partial [Flavobacteriaceae bacterium]|nr:hypothetical protein [Flavobacteriaceae bacterium]
MESYTNTQSKSETLQKDALLTNKPTQISGSQAIINALLAEGVSTVFGYPGGAIMPIYD